MKKVFCSLFTILIIFMLIYGNSFEDAKELIDLNGLRSNDDDWQVVKHEIFSEGGRIKLVQDKWLMYFLHWKPLTEERKNISIDYVQKLLLSFWGPNMPFSIIGAGGETTVAGHVAFYIDGSIYEGKIRTRFIVWNCPETKRQFIADCNINKARGTPNKFLKLQYDITSTITCHGQSTSHTFSNLKQKYSSEKYNLTFFIPYNWRTHEFKNPKWFPKGLTDTNGTLWTLLTDSNKYLELIWESNSKQISKKLFQQYLTKIVGNAYVSEMVTYKIDSINIDKIEKKEGYLSGDGVLSLGFEYKDQKGKTVQGKTLFFSKALLWENNSTVYFLLTAIISRQNMWGLPIDLSPEKEVREKFIKETVLPNIKIFNKTYSN